MNEHTLHHFGSFATHNAVHRRRVRAARKRVAATRVRMAKLHASAVPASDTLRATDTAD